jgi:hypothetical protein
MKFWPLFLGPLLLLVARVAWLNGDRLVGRSRAAFSWLAARMGIAADVQLTSVLVDDPTVLVGYRPAPPSRSHSLHSSKDRAAPGDEDEQVLLVSDCACDAGATMARLRQWATSGDTIVMWRNRVVGHVEFSQLRSGQQVRLSVIANP